MQVTPDMFKVKPLGLSLRSTPRHLFVRPTGLALDRGVVAAAAAQGVVAAAAAQGVVAAAAAQTGGVTDSVTVSLRYGGHPSAESSERARLVLSPLPPFFSLTFCIAVAPSLRTDCQKAAMPLSFFVTSWPTPRQSHRPSRL